LPRDEGEKSEEMILYGVHTTFEEVAKAAVPKFRTTPGRLLYAGFMAGAFIAFGFTLATIAACVAKFPPYAVGGTFNQPLFKLLLGAVFPMGLIAVVIAGADLWTGNVQSLGSAKGMGYADWRHVIYNWFGSYGGNFIGSIFLALMAVPLTGLFGTTGHPNPFGQAAVSIAQKKASLDAISLFFRGVGCNWLVNLAVWQAARVKDGAGKILAIWFPIFAFVAIGYEHAIANMWVIPTAVFASAHKVTWSQLFYNLMPVTLGNAVGGFLFVPFYYWYLGHPELSTKRVYRELLDFVAVTLLFFALAVLVPAGIAYGLEAALRKAATYVVPTVVSAYYAAGTFALRRIAR